MLPALLEVPTNPDEWGRWAFNNQNQVQLIQQAIFKKYNVTLTPYIIFPLNLEGRLFNKNALLSRLLNSGKNNKTWNYSAVEYSSMLLLSSSF